MYQVNIEAQTLTELKEKVALLYTELAVGVPVSEIKAEEPETPRRKFRVLLSPYPDINTGDVGEMMDEVGRDCIALRFEKLFTNAAKLENREIGKRIIAFEKKHLEEIK